MLNNKKKKWSHLKPTEWDCLFLCFVELFLMNCMVLLGRNFSCPLCMWYTLLNLECGLFKSKILKIRFDEGGYNTTPQDHVQNSPILKECPDFLTTWTAWKWSLYLYPHCSFFPLSYLQYVAVLNSHRYFGEPYEILVISTVEKLVTRETLYRIILPVQSLL